MEISTLRNLVCLSGYDGHGTRVTTVVITRPEVENALAMMQSQHPDVRIIEQHGLLLEACRERSYVLTDVLGVVETI